MGFGGLNLRTCAIAFSFSREGDLGLRHRLRIGTTRHQEVEALAEHLLAIVSG